MITKLSACQQLMRSLANATRQRHLALMMQRMNEVGELCIVGDVAWAFGVPIYDRGYFHCASLAVSKLFSDTWLQRLAQLCARYAIKQHVRELKVLRNGSDGSDRSYHRNIERNGGDCAFLEGCYDDVYRALFTGCFVSSSCGDECLQLPIINEVGHRDFVLFERGMGISVNHRHRLFVLLSIFERYLAVGAPDLVNTPPPWHPQNVKPMNKLQDIVEYQDLSNMLSDDEDAQAHDTSDVAIKQEHV